MYQKPPIAASLSSEIYRVLEMMKDEDPSSEEYANMAAQVKTLHGLKTTESPKLLTGDTVATIAANLLGIVLILNFERSQIMSKTALAFVKRLR